MEWNTERLRRVLEAVYAERLGQDTKYGDSPFNRVVYNMMMVLAEEVGEVSADLVEAKMNELRADECIDSDSIFYKHVAKANIKIQNARKELIQVAATAVSMVELIDSLEEEEIIC